MSAKKLTSRFLPEEETSLVQARINKTLRHMAADQMTKDRKLGIKVTWDALVEEAVKIYLEERGVKL